jgi:sugar/nucleoside kinase (ribokinase family)
MNESIFQNSSLCVAGNINRDIKTSPLAPDDRLFVDGETNVASIAETVGGGAANSAFGAAALGAQVAFLGKIGDDPLGDRLEQTLHRAGIAAYLARDSTCATGTSINLTYATGQRHFISSLPNNESLAFEDLDLEPIAKHGHMLRADLWFSDAMLFGGNQLLLEAAKNAGVFTSIDLNWDPRWSRASADQVAERKQAVRKVLHLVNLAHGNVRELQEFTDESDFMTALLRLEEWGAEGVVVHLGKDGAGYFRNGQLLTEPAIPAAQQIQTTGTGDVLSVCMMLLHGNESLTIPEKLRLANTIVSEFITGQRRLIPPIYPAH